MEGQYEFLADINGRRILYNPRTGQLAEERDSRHLLEVTDPKILKISKGLVGQLISANQPCGITGMQEVDEMINGVK
jgi:hypothetical protein